MTASNEDSKEIDILMKKLHSEVSALYLKWKKQYFFEILCEKKGKL